ncbi:hypothetical protein BEH_25600 (plasmid) [Priestia filamentosa]|uniref:Uncharacterized protein n=1 Tax=Priestia filamentosa TaxID=1402861 RepID=A0A231S2B7_9BACI|nr:hypothetical protein BEH_25600 [Priestia filamentosa]OXS65035.1 hypothetical protein B1B01_24035 [Priestia filamentosa]
MKFNREDKTQQWFSPLKCNLSLGVLHKQKVLSRINSHKKYSNDNKGKACIKNMQAFLLTQYVIL